jgi:transcriptional regulator with XRE-family HTH domain
VARPIGTAVERVAHTPEEAFGRAVTELRTKRGMTQEDLAHALGYHLSYIGVSSRKGNLRTFRRLESLARPQKAYR